MAWHLFKWIAAGMVIGCLAAPGVSGEEAPEGGTTATVERDAEVLPAMSDLQDRYEGVTNPDRPLAPVVRVGEKLTYLVRWNGIPAGTTTLRVKRRARLRDAEAYVFEMHSESNDFLSVFYEVDSLIKSFADAETGRSFLFRRRLREGRYQANDRLEFDYAHVDYGGRPDPVQRYAQYERGEGAKRKAPRPLPGPVQDPLSVLYYLRTFPFRQEGDAHEILMSTRKRTSIVRIEAIRFEQVAVDGVGTFESVVVEPSGEDVEDSDNLFVSKGKATIYLEKNTNIPLMVRVKISIGKATATLIKAEGSDLPNHAVAAPTVSSSTPQAAPTSAAALPKDTGPELR